MSQFRKGQSGNPKGRPKGTGQAAKLRQAIADDIPEIIEAMVKAAKDGDTAAAKLWLDRVIPALKPEAKPVVVAGLKQAGLKARAAAVLDAAAEGELAPDIAAGLVQAVGALARVAEIDELEKRLVAIERMHGVNR